MSFRGVKRRGISIFYSNRRTRFFACPFGASLRMTMDNLFFRCHYSDIWKAKISPKNAVFFLLLLSNFLCGFLLAENAGKISGTIKDKTNSEPLVGATVVLKGTKLGGITDVAGDYYILNVPPGTYNVTASIVGYGKVTQTEVLVRIDQTTTLNFRLAEEVVEAEGVTIVAEKPKVELDLTASKATVSREEISNGWVKDIKDVITDQSSTNINGGIRGSFGGDVSYRVDGLDLRDVGSNTNFSSVNLSTVQAIEVLTGGWNAEYGQANGAIVNIVSRKATDKIHAVATYKSRPSGKYHWGRNIYDKNDVFHTVMATPEFWDTSKTWRTQWMAPGESQKGNLGDGKFAKMTPQEKADWWKNFINDSKRFPQFDYADRAEWEQEVTIYGPILPELNFLVSGRYKEGVGIYPSALKYNPDMTLQGSLDWSPVSTTMVSFNGMFTKFENSGAPRTNYQSSETIVADNASQTLPFIDDPYNKYKFWFYGPSNNGGSFGDGSTIRAPERAQLMNVQAKLTQVFTPETFLNMAFQHSQMQYNLDFRDIAQTAQFAAFGLPSPTDSVLSYGVWLTSFGKPPTSNLFDSQRWGYAGDIWRSESRTKNYSVKADLTSQITKAHLVKSGFIFSLQEIKTFIHEGNIQSAPYVQVNDIIPIVDHPYEGAGYIQDKIEVGGMVLNAGIRFDFFNANKNVAADFYDPLMISEYTLGNSGKTGLIGYRPGGSGAAYVKTPTRYAFSPRIGISHPITETTVLHFMFGIFNQRPSWVKMLSNPVVWTDNRASGNLDDLIKANKLNSDLGLPDTLLVTYRYLGAKVGNPSLTWEKMTQYEVGIVQNIEDLVMIEATMYYKEGKDLTSLGIDQGPATGEIKQSGGNVDVRLYGDPFQADNRDPGKYIGNFTTTVNGAWADVRGIEMKMKSQFRWINVELAYTLSYLATGRYHDSKLFKLSSLTGKQLADNVFAGANNTDGGGIGVNDMLWNPSNSGMIKLTMNSPEDFGPSIMEFYPFGSWVVSSSTRWVRGNEFTWYPTDFQDIKLPNNRRWEDRWNTNMNISKNIHLADNISFKLFIQVTNLFNEKHLVQFSEGSTSLNNYMANNILPFQSTTKEPTEWNWYTNNPRQIYFGTTVEF